MTKKVKKGIDYSFLQSWDMQSVLNFYKTILEETKNTAYYWPTVSQLAKQDRFFLLSHLLGRTDVCHPWLYARCREVEANPAGHLDLWARFHYKSTIVTFAGAIQRIINNPNITICILSYNNATATAFLSQIKRELETNEDLIQAFPDIFFENPKRDAGAWSLDKGICVNRKSNPKENTVEAYGLVDNQPTSKHYSLRIYDDVVTVNSVTTAEMILKTTEGWEVSLNLGHGEDGNEQWYAGTRYNANDTYHDILKREYLIPRIYPATDDGTPDGNPVFMNVEDWEELKKGTSDYVLACQQLLNPLAGKQQELKPDWIRRYEVRPRTLNVYIMFDPAGGKKDYNCNTAAAVVGVDRAMNKYLLDGACHKMTLSERWDMVKTLFNKWKNKAGVQSVVIGYEKYSMQADIEHFEAMMKIEDHYIPIEEVGGSMNKDDRIRRLIPDHQNWRFFYPETDKITKKMRKAVEDGEDYLIAQKIKRINSEGKVYELTDWFLRNEYPFFPNATLKDFLDAMSRIYDLEIIAPMDYSNMNLESQSDHDNMGGPSYYKGMSMEPDMENIH